MSDESEQSGEAEQSAAVERAREEVVEAMARSASIYGLNRSYGRLYGVLYFADEPLSLDELVAESEYAKSTVSTAMKDMEQFHMVRRRSIPGEGKRAFFEAETDVWQILQEFLQREIRREIDVMQRALESAIETLEEADGEQAERDLEKVRRLERLYDRSERLVDLVTSSSAERLVSLLERLRGDDS